MKPTILVIEDEPEVQMILQDLLADAGYQVSVAGSAEEGLALLGQGFDLLLVDVMLPGQNGFQLCQQARQRGFAGAILMLTARTAVPDRIEGLKTGADDYVGKPFASSELLARVEALLRRVRKENLPPVNQFEFGEVQVDFGRAYVTRNGQPVNLASKEMQLLRFLIDHRGKTLTREELLEKVWSQQPYITPRTVDTHIAWLRQKLEQNPAEPKHIQTIRGSGYRFMR